MIARSEKEQERYEQQREYRLNSLYGITGAEYDAIKEAQGGACYLCQRAKGISRPLQVDHDHDGRGREAVRGLLCGRCNNRLGWVEARWDRIHAYLSHPPAKRVLGE